MATALADSRRNARERQASAREHQASGTATPLFLPLDWSVVNSARFPFYGADSPCLAQTPCQLMKLAGDVKAPRNRLWRHVPPNAPADALCAFRVHSSAFRVHSSFSISSPARSARSCGLPAARFILASPALETTRISRSSTRCFSRLSHTSRRNGFEG